MTFLNLELFPWLWSLHSCFDIDEYCLLSIASPLVCYGIRGAWGWREVGDITLHTGTSCMWEEQCFLSREMHFLVFSRERPYELFGWPPLSVFLHSSFGLRLSLCAPQAQLSRDQLFCVGSYWLNPGLFKTSALVSVKTLTEKLFLLILNLLKQQII